MQFSKGMSTGKQDSDPVAWASFRGYLNWLVLTLLSKHSHTRNQQEKRS